MTLSIAFGTVLLLLTLTPGIDRTSPFKIYTASWACLWLANGFLAAPFYLSTEVMLLVFYNNILFLFGSAAVILMFKCRQPFSTEMRQLESGYSQPCKKVIIYAAITSSYVFLEIGSRQLGINGGLLSLVGRNATGIFEIMRQGQSSLYNAEEFNMPWAIKITTVMVVFVSIILGVALGSKAKMNLGLHIWVSYVILIFAISTVTGVRSFILLGGLLFGFSALAANVHAKSGVGILKFKHLVLIIATGAAFLLWVILVQSARLQDTEMSRISRTIEHMRPWFGGYLPALSVWFDFKMPFAESTDGQLLARSLMAPLGLSDGEGLTSRIELEQIGDGRASNAMTIYRALWSDFGIFGGAIASYSFGCIAQLIYRKTIRNGGIWIPILGCTYCAVFFSINYWFFAYGARVMGATMAITVLGIIRALSTRRSVAWSVNRRF